MPAITGLPGYILEQKVVTVANDDTSINAALTAQAVDNWVAQELTLSGANMVILFSRTVVTPLT